MPLVNLPGCGPPPTLRSMEDTTIALAPRNPQRVVKHCHKPGHSFETSASGLAGSFGCFSVPRHAHPTGQAVGHRTPLPYTT